MILDWIHWSSLTTGIYEFINVTGVPDEETASYDKIRDQVKFDCRKEGDTYSIEMIAPGMPEFKESYKLDVEYESPDMFGSGGTSCKVIYINTHIRI